MIKTAIFFKNHIRMPSLPGRARRQRLMCPRRIKFSRAPWLKAVCNRVYGARWGSYEPAFRAYRVTEETTACVISNAADELREGAYRSAAAALRKRELRAIRAAIARAKSRYASKRPYPAKFKYRAH